MRAPRFSLGVRAIGIACAALACAVIFAPVPALASQTLYVNKYGPGHSATPGCASAAYTEIGSTAPSASGAVGGAASGDTIFICGSPTAANDPQTPTTGPYTPYVTLGTKSLTFTGDGPDRTILDGEGMRTQFFADLYDATLPSHYLGLEAMTITRGNDINSGGAVQSVCRDVTVDNVHFTDNVATGFGEGGGAIHASDPGCAGLADVTVTSSIFSGNVAEYDNSGAEGGASGGAIFAQGRVSVTDSTFTGNEARGTAVSPPQPARGGAIHAAQIVSVTDSSFVGNSVVGKDSHGGAISAGVYVDPSTITSSTFANNSTSGVGSFAGAVRALSPGVQVYNSTFTGNQAPDQPALSSSDDVVLRSVTSSGNTGTSPNYVFLAGGALAIGNSIINETGEACVAAGGKTDLGGNVIANTTANTGDCLPFVGTGGAPAARVDPSAIALQPLADNGGPTQTMALGLTSVARTSAGAQLPGTSPEDQRGLVRPLTDQSSGAYQLTTGQLTVRKSGSGSGSVTSSPTGIDCGAACSGQSAEFIQNPPFTTVTLTAVAATGSTFAGWSRPECTGTGPCAVPLDEAREVTATFTGSPSTPSTPVQPSPPTATTQIASARAVANRQILLRVRVNGPGTINVVGSYAAGPSVMTNARARACATTRTVTRAGTFTLSCRLVPRARALLATRSLRISLRVTLASGGGQASATRTVLVRKRGQVTPAVTG